LVFASGPGPIEEPANLARPKRFELLTLVWRPGLPLTHPRESHLLPLVERLVEVHERGADRGGGRAPGGTALAHRGPEADRGERRRGGAAAAEVVGGFQRRGDELEERAALRGAKPHVALDLAPRPAAQHRRKLLAHGAPAGRGGLASGLAWGGLARGRLAGGG